MIHILLCPHTLDFGGSQLSLHHWAKCLNRSRFAVTVLAMKSGGLSEKFEAHYPVYYDDTEYPDITGYIKRLAPDILHAGPGGGRDHEYIKKAASLVPVTQTVMCPRLAANPKDVISSVVPSRFVLSLQGPASDNVVQIDHPFDASDYDVKYGKDHFGLPRDKVIVGSLGNARRENEHFLRIARRYRNEDVHFVIKSDKRYRYLLGRKRVTVINRALSEDEKLSLINCFDVFLYPTSNEAYGIVFLEAMSQKVPIISYDDSAMREVIAEGGLLAPLNDIDEITRLLDIFVKDRAKREAVGQRGYELFKRRNDPRAIARKYELFFEGCLKRGYSMPRYSSLARGLPSPT